jgi:2-(1,2-epoxy-1,2-dihydrophenyl)acetyl-CoA isomerase
MSYDTVSVDRVDGVARVTMRRPEQHNSLDPTMAAELREATTGLVDDPEVRCLVLTGEGAAFNTGADLSTLEGDASDARRLRKLATQLHVTVRTLAGAGVPVVTGVNGVAAGGGFGLALCGDVVVVHEDARFEYAYPELGLSGDGGATYFLPRLVGRRTALEIALLDEPVPAEEAVELGLATEVADDDAFDDRVAELAATLADGPTRAYREIKRLLRESTSRSLGAQLTAEADRLARLATTEDYQRGYAAFFGDEEPTFEGQ